jgi:hypothetical protein
MEILSINFALFIVKIALCIIPVTIGTRLFLFSSETKKEMRQKLSSKLLGDPNLIEKRFFNFGLYFIACISIFIGLIIALALFLSSLK